MSDQEARLNTTDAIACIYAEQCSRRVVLYIIKYMQGSV